VLVLLYGGEEAMDLAHKLTRFAAHERLSAAQALMQPFWGAEGVDLHLAVGSYYLCICYQDMSIDKKICAFIDIHIYI
jgi:hypothetical protein